MIAQLSKVVHMTPRQIVARTVGKLFGITAEHHFTDRVLNLPSPIWSPPYPWSRLSAGEGKALIERLKREGLIIFPDFFTKDQLARIHSAIEAQFAPVLSPRMEFRPKNEYYACVQPLVICREFAEAAIDHDLLNLASGYFRRKPFLSESDFRRVLPLDMEEHERKDPKFGKGYSSSHWHYDLRGRQIKVQIYLTDVGPEDQNFSYCLGSHKGFKSIKYEKSRFSEARFEALGIQSLECLGSAGTAIVFDTNGIHRLRRRNTRTRDSLTFYYHPGRMYRAIPQAIHPEVLAAKREVFAGLTVLASPSLKK